MLPCDELKTIVLHHYGKFDSGEQAETIKELYSLQKGVTIIGNDPDEWFDDQKSIEAFLTAGGSSKREIVIENITAYFEGTVGWTMDRVKVKMSNGVELPVRHTRIFHKENGSWRLVHLHVSIPVPNAEIDS